MRGGLQWGSLNERFSSYRLCVRDWIHGHYRKRHLLGSKIRLEFDSQLLDFDQLLQVSDHSLGHRTCYGSTRRTSVLESAFECDGLSGSHESVMHDLCINMPWWIQTSIVFGVGFIYILALTNYWRPR